MSEDEIAGLSRALIYVVLALILLGTAFVVIPGLINRHSDAALVLAAAIALGVPVVAYVIHNSLKDM